MRSAKLGPEPEKGDLALISEWDTFYGQTLPKTVEQAFGGHRCNGGSACEWIHKLTYLRGLDGLTPMAGGAEERKQDPAATQGEKQAGAAGFFKTQTAPENLDRPVGQGQFDYLRRMSKDLHKTDEELKKRNRRIKAIGILGSDVFDKLLVMRALRPEFPEALFFTTDFDEAYTIESELSWTHNLIIGSSFGPKLNEKIQGEIPSFRNSYQTSAFLATLSAIGDPNNNWEAPTNMRPLKWRRLGKSYLRQERFWSSRLWRVSLYTLLMFLFLLYILVPILGQPITPTRGPHALGIYKWVSRTDFILMLFLAFFVFDATCFCLLLVNKLRRAKTRWPNATMRTSKTA